LYELPKALAAFSAPVAVELGHISQLISAIVGNKSCEIFRANTTKRIFSVRIAWRFYDILEKSPACIRNSCSLPMKVGVVLIDPKTYLQIVPSSG
jgi:hypothetical protein